MVAEIIDLNAFKAEFEKIKSNKELREKAIETIQQKVSDLDEKIVVAKRVASIRAKVDHCPNFRDHFTYRILTIVDPILVLVKVQTT